MIAFKCQVEYKVPYAEMLPFQGNLKYRSDDDIQKLARSLQEDGMLMPFVLWYKDKLLYILDGHARHAAIQLIAETDPEVLGQKYPAIIIEAETLEFAKQALLQISSQYGKITSKGLQGFIASSPHIKLENLSIKLPKQKVNIGKVKLSDETIIKIAVPNDKARQVVATLLEIGYIRIIK